MQWSIDPVEGRYVLLCSIHYSQGMAISFGVGVPALPTAPAPLQASPAPARTGNAGLSRADGAAAPWVVLALLVGAVALTGGARALTGSKR